MVHRAHLTERFVRSVKPPAQGEIWISDVRLRASGLRLWACKRGVGTAFAIRKRNPKDGRYIRRTFDPYDSRYFWHWGDGVPELASFADDAREWAADEIASIEGRPTLWEEDAAQRAQVRMRLDVLTFGEALETIFERMDNRGISQKHLDHIRYTLLPDAFTEELLETPIWALEEQEVAREIASSNVSLANVQKLRSFISSVSRQIGEFGGYVPYDSRDTTETFWSEVDRTWELPYGAVRDIPDETFPTLFAFLEAEQECWVSASCIRLFFEFGCKLAPLRTAEWWQIVDGHWYPYGEERGYWFLSRERISDEADQLLAKLSDRVTQELGPNPFLFPSQKTDGRKAISSVERFWRRAKKDVGLIDAPLTIFALRYRRKNTPSYSSNFLKTYGSIFQQPKNMAKMSKSRKLQKNNLLMSDGYR